MSQIPDGWVKQADGSYSPPKKGVVVVAESKPATSKKLESDIQDEIEQWLMTQGYRAWWDRKRMDVPTTSRKGVPDFIGCFSGVPFGMEVKRPGEKPTTEQLGELAWMRKAGAITAVVFSKEEAIVFLTQIKL